ncbi:MAG: TVP38/TMEM64 family protein [Verrucomicrobiales bacterium]|nr:MAG: TVP38/TMEM64 family protein [Verrucomicrobiaceae bacterium]
MNPLKEKWFWGCLIVIGIILCQIQFDLIQTIPKLIQWIESLGIIGMSLFVLVYILACIFLIPGSPLTVGAGAVFGFWTGLILVSVGSTLGAVAAFLISRYLARGFIEKKIDKSHKFSAMDMAIKREGWKIIFLARLSPIIPFFLLNYALGLTKIRLRTYIISSWAGMIPGTVLYTYIGSLGKTILTTENSLADWVILGAGLIATVSVTLIISKIAKRSLALDNQQ